MELWADCCAASLQLLATEPAAARPALLPPLQTGKPLFAGRDEGDQASKIFQVLGQPTELTMPGCTKYPK